MTKERQTNKISNSFPFTVEGLFHALMDSNFPIPDISIGRVVENGIRIGNSILQIPAPKDSKIGDRIFVRSVH